MANEKVPAVTTNAVSACGIIIAGLIFGFGLAICVNTYSFRLEKISIWYWSIVTVGLQLLIIAIAIIRILGTRVQVDVDVENNEAVEITKMKVRTKYFDVGVLEQIGMCISLALFIWGSIIYSQSYAYPSIPYDLWIFFSVLYWTNIANMCLICCCGALAIIGICISS